MRIFKGTIIGGIAFFLLGWLIYGILLMDYNLANYNQCANRAPEDMVWWAIIISNFATALLLTVILNWADASVAIDGLKVGAIYGFLSGLAIDLSFYSMTLMFNNLGAMLVDIITYTFLMAIVGLVIVVVWGKRAVTP